MKVLVAVFFALILVSSVYSAEAQNSKPAKPTITFNVTGKAGQKSIVVFKACNFSQINPEFRIISDQELGLLYDLTDGVFYGSSCTRDIIVMVKAKDPKSIQIKLEPRDKAGDEPKIIIKTISPTKMPDRYQVVFKVCAAKKTLQNPTIFVQSDEAEEYLSIVSRIGSGTCATKDVMVFAKDPNTIKIEILGNKKSTKPDLVSKSATA